MSPVLTTAKPMFGLMCCRLFFPENRNIFTDPLFAVIGTIMLWRPRNKDGVFWPGIDSRMNPFKVEQSVNIEPTVLNTCLLPLSLIQLDNYSNQLHSEQKAKEKISGCFGHSINGNRFRLLLPFGLKGGWHPECCIKKISFTLLTHSLINNLSYSISEFLKASEQLVHHQGQKLSCSIDNIPSFLISFLPQQQLITPGIKAKKLILSI